MTFSIVNARILKKKKKKMAEWWSSAYINSVASSVLIFLKEFLWA